MDKLKETLEEIVLREEVEDASHGISHARRVWKLCLEIIDKGSYEVDHEVLIAAAYLHDIVTVPKNHPDRKRASALSADRAVELLQEIGYPKPKLNAVHHAVLTHSFSAGITPETLEAKVLQDADRMEAIGAIGVARCFYTAGLINSDLFDPQDPEGEGRELNDSKFALDHFKVKLFKLPSMMQTDGGRAIANERVDFMKAFVNQILTELKM